MELAWIKRLYIILWIYFLQPKEMVRVLGTSLSKEIIELHGGNIKYLSELNVGTKVIISLPL